MVVINERRLDEFARRHANSRRAPAAWLAVTRDTQWHSLSDVRRVFPAADGVEVRRNVIATVFNIRGNRYRIITLIIFAAQTVDIVEVLTHADYSKNTWKKRI